MLDDWNNVPPTIRRGLLILFVLFGPIVFGCSGFQNPRSVAVDLRDMGLPPEERERVLGYRDAPAAAPAPAAPSPAVLVLVEVTAFRPGSNNWSPAEAPTRTCVVTRDAFPDAEQFATLAQLPGVLTARPLDTRVIGLDQTSLAELRAAALRQRADILFVYSFDAFAESADRFAVGTVLTLGLLPTMKADATATVHAALVDTRTGYIYGFAEAEADARQLANVYSDLSARRNALFLAERRAFARLIETFPRAWERVRPAR